MIHAGAFYPPIKLARRVCLREVSRIDHFLPSLFGSTIDEDVESG